MNKILMLSHSSILFDSRIQKEAKSLKENDYQVSILSIEDQASEKALKNLEEQWEMLYKNMDGITFFPLKLKTRSWVKLPKTLNKLFQATELLIKGTKIIFKEKPNYLHCHDLALGFFCFFDNFFSKKPKLIFDSHELQQDSVVNSPSFVKKYYKKYEQWVISKSNAIITVNSSIAEIMEKNFGKKVFILENKPLNIVAEELDKNILRKKYHILTDKDIIIYVGIINLERGLDNVVAALQYLPEKVVFAILGVGRIDEVKNFIYKKCEEYNINSERVLFLEPVSPNLVTYYLHGGNISVLLYQSKMFDNNMSNAPNKLFQSIVGRVPILASSNSTFPKYIYENPYGHIGEIVDETAPKEIADKIKLMLEPKKQEEYRQNAAKFAVELTWESEEKKLLEIYKAIQ